MLDRFHGGRQRILPYSGPTEATSDFPSSGALRSFEVIDVAARLSGVLATPLLAYVALGEGPVPLSRAALMLCLLRYTGEVVVRVRRVRLV
ncbi:hypothetical protein [Streptomyces sp. Y1]|uniref:Uncharacterized protein n=1 Tax=Streptomyces sp. Y1 TaxID=3238634 RepID=A0AB39TQ62_9ACTN